MAQVSSDEEQILDGSSELEYNESNESDSEFLESDASESDDAYSRPLIRSTRSGKFNISSDDDEEDESEGTGPMVLDAAMDDDEEEADLEAAIMASRVTASGHINGPTSDSGPSSKSSRITAAALRAFAAEKRLRQENSIDDRNAFSVVDLASFPSSDEEIAPTKGKSRAKKGTKSKVTPINTPDTKHMTLAEMRRARREAKIALRMQYAPLKHEEMLLRRELGRKLTYVSVKFFVEHYDLDETFIAGMKAEKSTVALYLYHPELKTVWGDLESDIPVIEPKRAPQPKQLKAILLPFQQVVLADLIIAMSFLRPVTHRKVFTG